uniref:Dynein regulatory complex protein 12 n=1 Tax=Neolamprologus brichardi TaxID=32507 RepID=A0A3Q4H1T0_NEOBR
MKTNKQKTKKAPSGLYVQCLHALRRVQSDRADLRRRLIAVLAFQSESAMKSVIADANVILDLSRQYKTMQTELTNKVKKLEQEVSQLKEDLVLSQEELSKEKSERKQGEKEKDAIIADLRQKLDNMESDYEKILHETLDSLSSQLSATRQGWKDESATLHQKYKELLSEFGLNALDL